jgi:hypothetical protein
MKRLKRGMVAVGARLLILLGRNPLGAGYTQQKISGAGRTDGNVSFRRKEKCPGASKRQSLLSTSPASLAVATADAHSRDRGAQWVQQFWAWASLHGRKDRKQKAERNERSGAATY